MIALVGSSWRTATTLQRAQLSAAATEAIASLRASGYVAGAACIATCSRTEWVLTADQPEWAGNLLRSALAARLPELDPRSIAVRAGGSAINHLLRVVVGLDSVAEGESAVGRQVLRAFEHSRTAGLSDRRLRHVWKHVERLIHLRRDAVPSTRALGVQTLVREALQERELKTVAILGRGDFGQAMERSLRAANRWELSTYSRQSLDELVKRLPHLDALVICTGGPAPWLTLPARRSGLCIDTGAPPQLLSAPGWETLGLDELLARPERQLPDDERERLELLVAEATAGLLDALNAPAPSRALAAIDAERSQFLNQELPALLSGLSPKEARRVRQAVSAFTHKLIQRTKESTS